jgi:Kef-type K+ transport system membrane component KefB
MWLPTPIYERIPQFWLLLGLLFMSSGTYLGFDYSLSFLYFGVGFVCCLWSLKIFAMRLIARQTAGEDDVQDAEPAA